jgi:hypothetical protein
MTTLLDIKRPITALDRCDRCQAQAMIRATLINGELYFCGHHGREVSQSLIAKSTEVYDPEGVFNYGK